MQARLKLVHAVLSKSRSRRQVVLYADAVEALLKHKAQRRAASLVLGGKYIRESLAVLEPATGGAWAPDRFSFTFNNGSQGLHSDPFPGAAAQLRNHCAASPHCIKITSDFVGYSAIGITADM